MTQVRQIPAVDTPLVQEQRFRLFLAALIGVILVLPILLLAIEQFSVRTYFILCFLWFLISSEIFAPSDPETLWWGRLKWVKAAGWLVFAYIIAERFGIVA